MPAHSAEWMNSAEMFPLKKKSLIQWKFNNEFQVQYSVYKRCGPSTQTFLKPLGPLYKQAGSHGNQIGLRFNSAEQLLFFIVSPHLLGNPQTLPRFFNFFCACSLSQHQDSSYIGQTLPVYILLFGKVHKHFVNQIGFKHPAAYLRWNDRKVSVEISKLNGRINSEILQFLKANYF